MKKFLLIILAITLVSSINAQQIFTISNSGFTFSPATLTVSQGDVLRFTVGAAHPVLQVSQSTYQANGTTPLPGGFSFPSGTGDYTTTSSGTIYYVCTAHVSLGMRGTVTVNPASDVGKVELIKGGSIYPNPAGDFLIYQTDGISKVKEIRILTLSGESVLVVGDPVYSDQQVRINLGNLSNGIYFILIKTDDRTISGKFIKA